MSLLIALTGGELGVTVLLSLAGTMRLAERGGRYTPVVGKRMPRTLEPVVARLGIDLRTEKPAILGRGG
jgi:hypothetical protein